MRFRTIIIATSLAAGLVQTAGAFSPHKGTESQTVASGRAPRLHRNIGWTAPASAQLGTLATWNAIWDRDTDVPARMWGPSIAIAHSTANAAVAEAAARSFLAEHIATLAPGASPADFVVISNQVDAAGVIRSVGFAQRANGLPVYSGNVGFVFERDHLIMVGSTALPNISVRMPAATLSTQAVANAATSWLAQSNIDVAVRNRSERMIVPIVHARAAHGPIDIEYRVVETISVESTREAGRWDVWVDASDASPIARRATLSFASGTINFDVPDRYPGSTRGPKPAPNVNHTINGTVTQSTVDGVVTWAGTGAATVSPGLTGPLVAITNKAGSLVSESLSLADNGSMTWSKATDPLTDAQLDAFVFASTAKAFVKARLNPNLAWLDGTVSVNVNEAQTCNAFSTGDDIHFFKSNTMCENTGRIADVVYHEFGHSVHNNSIIPGVGQFDGSLSEGLADTLAVSITGDHGMGRGFFFNDMALRDVDPVGVEKKWPDDADGEVHDEGEIIGEALYDLRKALQTKLGDGPGFDQFLKVYYGVMQRASDIPTSYAAALVADDDDGNLGNGTPNQCELNAAFALHGLTDPAASLGLKPPTVDGSNVSIGVTPPSGTGACQTASVTSVTLSWAVQADAPVFADLPLAANGAGTIYSVTIPKQPDGTVVLYHITVALSDNTSIVYPQNPADPNYQLYNGPVQIIKCFDFEAGAADWTHGATPANRDEWQAGMPLGIGGDPNMAHGGTSVFGIDLGSDDGQYKNSTKQWAQSPDIDLGGATAVRLQYYRWLGVEDGAYDNGIIYANDAKVWSNLASPGMPTTEVNHVDKEWRFQDVDISAQAAAGKVHIKFELDSDQGLTFGGWTIDDVCVVAIANQALCGNGVLDPGESCDDGNKTDGDGCSATCAVEACADSGGGTNTCGGGGCCSSTRDPSGAIVLSVFTVGLVLRRRRRRATVAV